MKIRPQQYLQFVHENLVRKTGFDCNANSKTLTTPPPSSLCHAFDHFNTIRMGLSHFAYSLPLGSVTKRLDPILLNSFNSENLNL